MLKVIKCPSCAAPLECDGDAFEKCDFCGSQVAVTQQNSFSPNSVGFDGLLNQAHKLREILGLARSGKKIEAIKIYRETFGVGLKEAKDAVERLELGQSVSFQNVQFRSANVISPEAAKTALKAFGIFSGSMLLISGIVVVFIGLIVVGVLWTVRNKINQVSNISIPTSSTPKQTGSEKPSFAKEILRFGGEGNGAGKFKDNRVIAVDGEGKIYSADYEGGRVQVFDKDGKFLTQWFVTRRDSVIYSLAVNRNGTVFITQPSKIATYEGASGKLLNEAKLDITSAIYPTADNKIIAANKNDILIIDDSLKIVSTIKNASQNAGIKNGFNYLAVNGLGEIFATSDGGKDLVKFSADGKFLDRFKIKSTSIQDMAIDAKGRIFVAETSKIWIYQANGDLIDSFDSKQSFAIIFDEADELLMASRPFIVKYSINQ